jgi:histone-lysine N-methyltransferase SETD3
VLQRSAHSGRGIHAAAPLAAGDVVLQVPQRCMLTMDAARSSAIGRQIVAAGITPENNHTWLAAYLLQERHAKNSAWKIYFELLPPSLSSYRFVPLLFEAHELELLRGSFLLDQIRDRWEALEREYERLARGVPALRALGFEEFVWARLLVASRVFGVTIAGRRTQALVPLADLCNHKSPPGTRWGYRDAADGFVMTAAQEFAPGQALHDSYGRKCNGRYFMTYGFVLPENYDNEARLEFEDRGGVRVFLVPARYAASETQQMFAFLRGSRNRRRSSRGRNEQEVVRRLGAACERALSGFDTTLAKDDALLLDPRVTGNVRNCLLMRQGEKRVLHTFLQLAHTALPVLRMLPHYARRRAAAWDAGPGRFADYFESLLLPFVR